MSNRDQPPYEKQLNERRTPIDNDVDPDGMDSDNEGDELEAGPADDDLGNGPDGALDHRSTGQGRTSGTHGAADSDTAAPRKRR